MGLDRKAATHISNVKRRRGAASKDKFASLIASPFALGTVVSASPLPNPLVLPASGFIGVSSSVVLTSGQLTIALSTGRSLGTTALAVDQIHRLGFAETAVTIIPTCAIAGVITLYYFDEWKNGYAIATGTFT